MFHSKRTFLQLLPYTTYVLEIWQTYEIFQKITFCFSEKFHFSCRKRHSERKGDFRTPFSIQSFTCF